MLYAYDYDKKSGNIGLDTLAFQVRESFLFVIDQDEYSF